eukprot:COSAG01_NODE_35218_length_535_cov_0.958716_1_plen_76_part_10
MHKTYIGQKKKRKKNASPGCDTPAGVSQPVLAPYQTSISYTNLQYTDQRNVLVLAASADLDNWTILRTLLHDDTGL